VVAVVEVLELVVEEQVDIVHQALALVRYKEQHKV
jgi:hypothetical protein